MTSILISGAGIAGLTLAHWLRRHGMTPTLVERSTSLRDGGYKVDIRGAALDVVERMGLLDDVRSYSTDVGRGDDRLRLGPQGREHGRRHVRRT
ncbi:FAD-dependent monooxygenase [Occultella gossypii]|uniref:FAD-dependent monooxygenase n=1 Tax=Occultella gossypii TaxID=2800820 RepID=A0ABS7S9E9_9MICO|nr:FAD-dependent monooxygenase [Occultella gossypii]MBZ2196967.1 FAD-dependent monooxygenase [Occultella gossypii]